MKRYKSNENYFKIIDTEAKAYLLGFFIADGSISLNSKCVNSYRLQVALTIDDIKIVELFNKEICPNNKIKYTHYKKGAKNRRPVCNIRWTSTIMKNDLELLYDIKTRKTYHEYFKFDFLKIPEEYHFSFIRGYFDGDGHVSFSETNKQFTFAFYGTSKLFLQQIGDIISKNCNVSYCIDCTNKKNVNLYCLRFKSIKRRFFIEKLYKLFYTGSRYHLDRKRIKFESYLNTVLSR